MVDESTARSGFSLSLSSPGRATRMRKRGGRGFLFFSKYNIQRGSFHSILIAGEAAAAAALPPSSSLFFSLCPVSKKIDKYGMWRITRYECRGRQSSTFILDILYIVFSDPRHSYPTFIFNIRHFLYYSFGNPTQAASVFLPVKLVHFGMQTRVFREQKKGRKGREGRECFKPHHVE